MTVSELRDRIQELEYLIGDEVEKIEKESGVLISDISIDRINTMTYDSAAGVPVFNQNIDQIKINIAI